VTSGFAIGPRRIRRRFGGPPSHGLAVEAEADAGLGLKQRRQLAGLEPQAAADRAVVDGRPAGIGDLDHRLARDRRKFLGRRLDLERFGEPFGDALGLLGKQQDLAAIEPDTLARVAAVDFDTLGGQHGLEPGLGAVRAFRGRTLRKLPPDALLLLAGQFRHHVTSSGWIVVAGRAGARGEGCAVPP
jgi:hypothetical protein